MISLKYNYGVLCLVRLLFVFAYPRFSTQLCSFHAIPAAVCVPRALFCPFPLSCLRLYADFVASCHRSFCDKLGS